MLRPIINHEKELEDYLMKKPEQTVEERLKEAEFAVIKNKAYIQEKGKP